MPRRLPNLRMLHPRSWWRLREAFAGASKEKHLRQKVKEQKQTLRRLRQQLETKEKELEDVRRAGYTGTEVSGVRPHNVVWIFCCGRSGSTWLARMLGGVEGNALWDEPLVGALFGDFYRERGGHKRGAKFVMGARHRDAWLSSIRHTVLRGAESRYPELPENGCLVVKEPHGSVGAPLLVEALPESRVVLLLRDPRDTAASLLDAHRENGWISQGGKRRPRKPWEGADPDTFVESSSDPDGFLRTKLERTFLHLSKAREAYEMHQGRKALVKYEDLRADPAGTLRRLCDDLGMTVDDGELTRMVEENRWENLPEGEKGEGKFYRKAIPGSWKEDLTARQVELVESMAGPLLFELYEG